MTNDRPQILFVGSYEAREVPKGWQHPRDEGGRYVPLLPFGYRFDPSQAPAPTMPEPGADPDVMAYETVSEGTPISSAFPNTPQGRLDLLRYCVEHCTTMGRKIDAGAWAPEHRTTRGRKIDAEAWAAILFGDAAIGLDGQVSAND